VSAALSGGSCREPGSLALSDDKVIRYPSGGPDGKGSWPDPGLLGRLAVLFMEVSR